MLAVPSEEEEMSRPGHLRAARVGAGVLAVASLTATVPLLMVLFGDTVIHRTHEATIVLFFLVLVAGSLTAVATRPQTAPGALRVILAAGVANLVVAMLTPRVDPVGLGLVAMAVAVDRIGRFGMWRETWHLRRWEATLPVLLIAGFGSYMWDQIQLHVTSPPTDEHVRFGHYTLMATALLGIALAGLVGASEVDGNHVAGTLAGSAAVLIGVASLLTGEVSSFGLAGELMLVLGGLLFVGMVQLERLGLHPQSPRGPVTPRPGSAPPR